MDKFYNTVCFLEDRHCKDCGWPVVDACCNWGTCPDGQQWDWWQYCSNKMCKNHKGEGIFQDEPRWIERD